MADKNIYTLTNDELRSLQLTQLEILKLFADFCFEHKLLWQIAAGTLLGAVRHRGFIPWDDDIDVIMPRKDYELLLRLGDKFPNQVFLQHKKTEPNCPFLFSKLRLNNTLFKERYYQHIDMHHGIFIDIFPYDRVEPNRFLGYLHFKFCRCLNLAFLLSSTSEIKQVGINRHPFSKAILRILYLLIKLVPQRQYFGVLNYFFGLLKNAQTSHWASLVDAPYEQDKFYKRLASNELMTEFQELTFEGYQFPATLHTDKMLKRLYDDYWLEPAIEQRAPHHEVTAFKPLTSIPDSKSE